MSAIKVMGHCPPDTDSTCSPIVYAWYLREHQNMDAEAYVGGPLNREAEFVLNYFGVNTPQLISEVSEGDKLVLVDTNNPEELISGWEKAEIIEIVDHHKLFGLKTNNPIKITMRPYGSVPAILWELMPEVRDSLPREIAGMMLACLLSDTLKFTSVTTTEFDKEVGLKLVDMLKLDIDEFAAEMFAAKSNLAGMSPQQILLTDAKDFEFGGKVYKIAVMETTDPSQPLAMRADLEVEIEKMKQAENLAGMFFFVVDIVNSNAKLFTTSEVEKSAAEKAFNMQFDETGIMTLPGVVSRKKQIAPVLESVLG